MLYETSNDAESGDESDDDSIMPPLLSKEEMYAMDYGDESDDEHMYMETIECIRDGIQTCPSVNKR